MKKNLFGLFVFIFLMIIPSVVFAAPRVFIDGKQLVFDVEPTTEQGYLLVPLRAIFEGLGAQIDWNVKTKTVTAAKNDLQITLKIGENKAQKNGQEVSLTVPAKMIDNRTMVPLRFVGEALGTRVDWFSSIESVSITTDPLTRYRHRIGLFIDQTSPESFVSTYFNNYLVIAEKETMYVQDLNPLYSLNKNDKAHVLLKLPKIWKLDRIEVKDITLEAKKGDIAIVSVIYNEYYKNINDPLPRYNVIFLVQTERGWTFFNGSNTISDEEVDWMNNRLDSLIAEFESSQLYKEQKSQGEAFHQKNPTYYTEYIKAINDEVDRYINLLPSRSNIETLRNNLYKDYSYSFIY